jgi:hypothetical protein
MKKNCSINSEANCENLNHNKEVIKNIPEENQTNHIENILEKSEGFHLSLVLDDETTLSIELNSKEEIGPICKNICKKYNLSKKVEEKLKSRLEQQILIHKKEINQQRYNIEKAVTHRLHYRSKLEKENREQRLETIRKQKADNEVKGLTFSPVISHIKNYKKPFINIEDKLYYEDLVKRNKKVMQNIIKKSIIIENDFNNKKPGHRKNLSMQDRSGISFVAKSSALQSNNLSKNISPKSERKIPKNKENPLARKNKIEKMPLSTKNVERNINNIESGDINLIKNTNFSQPSSQFFQPTTSSNLFPIAEKQNSFESLQNLTNFGSSPKNDLKESLPSFTLMNNIIKDSDEKNKKVKKIEEINMMPNYNSIPTRRLSFANKEQSSLLISNTVGGSTYAEKYKLQQMQKESNNVTNCSYISSQSKTRQIKSKSVLIISELKKKNASDNVNQYMLKDLSEGIGDKIRHSLGLNDMKNKIENNQINIFNDDSFAIYSEPHRRDSITEENKLKNNKEETLTPELFFSCPISPRSEIKEELNLEDSNSIKSNKKTNKKSFTNQKSTRANSECVFSYKRKYNKDEYISKTAFERLYTDHQESKLKKEESIGFILKKECPFNPKISERSRKLAINSNEHKRSPSVFKRLGQKMIQVDSQRSKSAQNASKPIIQSKIKKDKKMKSEFKSELNSDLSPSLFIYRDRTRLKIRELKEENKLYQEIANISKSSNNLNIEIKHKFKENLQKFKLDNFKDIFDVIYRNCHKVDDFLKLEKFGVCKNLKEKLILPTCYLIKERKLPFTFETFYSVANEIMNFII